MDRLTKFTHILSIESMYKMDKYTHLYINEMLRVYGVPVSIVSNKDQRFTSWFWKCLHEAIGTKLSFSTTFPFQTDGQSERTV